VYVHRAKRRLTLRDVKLSSIGANTSLNALTLSSPSKPSKLKVLRSVPVAAWAAPSSAAKVLLNDLVEMS
jgi:hypothetical protein